MEVFTDIMVWWSSLVVEHLLFNQEGQILSSVRTIKEKVGFHGISSLLLHIILYENLT